MFNILKRIGDLFVVVVLLIGFKLIFENYSDVSDWDVEEWICVICMTWITLRFMSGLMSDLMDSLVSKIKKELEKELTVSK